MKRQHSLTRSTWSGAVAGAFATWLMNRVTTYLYEREGKKVQLRENRARRGRTAYETAAERFAGLLGQNRLTKAKRQKYGNTIHWTLGATAGAAYALLRSRVPAARLARGLAFGAAFWLLVDEGMVYALRLAPGPKAFPWQTHIRGLAGHLSFAAAADAALRVLEPIA